MLEPRGKWSRYIGCLPGRVSEQMVEFTGKIKDRIEAHMVKKKGEKKRPRAGHVDYSVDVTSDRTVLLQLDLNSTSVIYILKIKLLLDASNQSELWESFTCRPKHYRNLNTSSSILTGSSRSHCRTV